MSLSPMAFVHLHERPLPVAFGPGHIPIPFIRMWEGDSWFRCLSWTLRCYVALGELTRKLSAGRVRQGTVAGTSLDGLAWALFRDRYLPCHKHLPARASPLELTTNQRAGSLNRFAKSFNVTPAASACFMRATWAGDGAE